MGMLIGMLITETVKRVTKHVICKEILDHGPFSPLHPLQCKSKSLPYIGLLGRILFHVKWYFVTENQDHVMWLVISLSAYIRKWERMCM